MKLHLFILVTLTMGCAQQQEEPEGLLDRSTFTEILTEAQLIEARMNHEIVVEQRKQVPMGRYYDQLFERFGTDRDQFERTFHYYAARPADLKAIYEEVIAELSRRKDLVPVAEQLSHDTLRSKIDSTQKGDFPGLKEQ